MVSNFLDRNRGEKEIAGDSWIHSNQVILRMEEIGVIKNKEVFRKFVRKFERLINENPMTVLWMISTGVSNLSRGEDAKSTNCRL